MAFASERQKIVDDIEKSWSVPARGLTERDSGLWDSTPQPANRVVEQRKKVKGCPEPPEPISLPRLENLEIKGDKTPPLKAIKQQNYTILNGMFNSSPDSTTKTVDWDAFITAMADAGLLQGRAVVQQSFLNLMIGKGVVWQYRVTQFHPVTKIGSITLRSISKRIEKWFS
jgi:hypothetical protein